MMKLLKSALHLWETEPVLVIGFLHAGVTLAAAFGVVVHLTGPQFGALEGVLTAADAVVARSQVSPTK